MGYVGLWGILPGIDVSLQRILYSHCPATSPVHLIWPFLLFPSPHIITASFAVQGLL
jgi:hypothetical protein